MRASKVPRSREGPVSSLERLIGTERWRPGSTTPAALMPPAARSYPYGAMRCVRARCCAHNLHARTTARRCVRPRSAGISLRPHLGGGAGVGSRPSQGSPAHHTPAVQQTTSVRLSQRLTGFSAARSHARATFPPVSCHPACRVRVCPPVCRSQALATTQAHTLAHALSHRCGAQRTGTMSRVQQRRRINVLQSPCPRFSSPLCVFVLLSTHPLDVFDDRPLTSARVRPRFWGSTTQSTPRLTTAIRGGTPGSRSTRTRQAPPATPTSLRPPRRSRGSHSLSSLPRGHRSLPGGTARTTNPGHPWTASRRDRRTLTGTAFLRRPRCSHQTATRDLASTASSATRRTG